VEYLLLYFQDLPIHFKAIWLFSWIAVFWTLEGFFPFRIFNYKKWIHAKPNFILLVFVLLINICFGVVTGYLIQEDSTSTIGLLQFLNLPVYIELLISILFLDLIAQYFAHFLLHKIPVLWRLHMVHHSDKEVDVTTGTRHHPIDFIFRETLALFTVILLGMPIAYYMIYRILSVFFTYFTHANITLPNTLDSILSLIFVTPSMHKFHHHYKMPWTDTNYGNMFSIWDRIFSTYLKENSSEIIYGLDCADHTNANSIGTQLGLPFNKTIKKIKD